jgi:hypothetical protein
VVVLVEDDHVETAVAEVVRGGDTRRSRADDDDVVHGDP